MEFNAVLEARRSGRNFDPSPAPEEHIQAIIRAGCLAPSPLNLQPWEFIVITAPEVKAEVRRTSEKAKQAVLDNGGPSWVNKYGMDFLDAAPVMIAVLVDPTKGGLGGFFGQTLGALQAGSACVQNMMLAGAELGYESLWFTFFHPDEMKATLGVPGALEVAGVVLFGKPVQPTKAPPRRAPVIHRQKY
jgi:nitroreductase